MLSLVTRIAKRFQDPSPIEHVGTYGMEFPIRDFPDAASRASLPSPNPQSFPMRPLLTLISLSLPSLLFAHPGHGAVASETRPMVHYLTSGSHAGWVAVIAVAAIAVYFLLRSRRAAGRRA
ncbi:hypothetical protein [Rosistilla carotiformis]|uniref:hypothetical protein n=1 Tax=Rosistilla carotiformis TaxID=2528017 RepID=UPI0011A50DBF|nr:hypothetical protein [Rosistilla carotiformis]